MIPNIWYCSHLCVSGFWYELSKRICVLILFLYHFISNWSLFSDLYYSVYKIFINCARICSHISKCYALEVCCYEVISYHKNNEVGTKEKVEYGITEQANFSEKAYCFVGGCISMCYRLLTLYFCLKTWLKTLTYLECLLIVCFK